MGAIPVGLERIECRPVAGTYFLERLPGTHSEMGAVLLE